MTTPSSTKWRASMPGPLADPLVGGLHAVLEPRVGDEPRWERRADAADGGVPGHDARGYRTEPVEGSPQLRHEGAASRGPDGDRAAPGHDALHQLREDVAGPGLDEGVAPASASARTHASQRTGETTWRAEQLAQPPGVGDQLAGHVLGDGDRAGRELDPRRAPRAPAATAGRISARVERAGHRQPHGADLPLLRERLEPLDRRHAAADAPTWAGEFSFATTQHVVVARLGAERLGVLRARRPSSAAIVPGRSSPARCIASPADHHEPQRVGQGERARRPRARRTPRASARPPRPRPSGPRRAAPGTRPHRRPAAPAGRTRWSRAAPRRGTRPRRRDPAPPMPRPAPRRPAGCAGPRVGHPGGLRSLAGEEHRDRHRGRQGTCGGPVDSGPRARLPARPRATPVE